MDELLQRGHAHFEAEEYPQALAAYDEARHYGYSRVYWERGDALSHLQRYEEAPAEFDHDLALDPNWRSYDSKGDVLEQLGRKAEAEQSYQQALEALEQALGEHPDWARAYASRGDALTKLGRTVEAEEAYKKAAELEAEED